MRHKTRNNFLHTYMHRKCFRPKLPYSLQESVLQSEYNEAVRADRIKTAVKRTLHILLTGDIDFAQEIRIQGTASVKLDE